MEAPEPTCPAPSAREQPAPVPGRPGALGGQTSPRLTLGPVLLPPEQGLAPTVFLKALPIPLYHTVPPGGLQPRAPLVTAGSLDGGGVPFILSPLLQPEGTVSIVGALPVLSPGPGPALGSPGKVRNAGKYLCPHCGRDCLKPSVLEKHIRSHTGERPFPCTTCRIAFKTQSNLYKHRRTQTHLNNSRLSSESEGAGAGLPEEADKAAESSRASMAETALERPLSPGAQLPLGPAPTDREAPLGSTPVLSPGLPPGSTQLWRQQQQPSQDQRPSSLQQQATPWEKPWDPRGSEGRLRKCESTDSGYLSRSDSAEQPPPVASPLHSLSEHSTESEGEGGPGTGTRRPQTESRVPGDSLELEKKRLEERITRLISHNQAVVGDPQLEHVRPRKTVLSKQGSIDLPTPYTYKGSFHFDIRALEPGRRKAALGPARSTLTPLDKSRPLFFHSVPTQLSTTVECVPVTRSNSLPSVDGSRTWPEPADRQARPLSPRRAIPARSGYRVGLTLADIPSGHPRALVRQAAVEDLPWTPAGDTLGPEEEAVGRRATPGEGTTSKGRVAGRRRSGQRRLEMFSQEKWQVYGHETFQRFYQKAKSSCHGAPRAGEGRGGGGTAAELPPPQEEAVGSQQGTAQNRETPVHRHVSGGVKPDESLGPKSPKLGEERAGAGAHEHCRATRATPPPSPGSQAQACSASRNPLLPPSMRLELPPAPGPLQQGDLEASRLVLPEHSQEGDTEDTGPQARSILRWPSSGSREPNLPSERKKPKVERLGKPEVLVAETPGVPTRVASPQSLKQDSDSQKTPEQLHRSVRQVDEALETPGVSSEESTQHAVAIGPGHQSMVAPQPRATAHDAFPPKYLLRLLQQKTPPSLSGSQPPWHDQDSLRSGGPKERVSFVGLALTLSTATGPAPGQAGSISWDSWEPRAYAQRKEQQVGVEWGAGAVSFGPSFVQDAEVGPHTLSHPCPPASTRPSGSYLDLWASGLGLGRLPGNALPEPPLGPGLQLTLPCPVKPGTFPSAAGRPELASSRHSGNPRNLRDPSTFPSLRTEPQLTWCCLSRSVPLPVEQEKAASLYLAMHFPGGALCDEGHNPQPVGQEEWTRTCPGEGELALMPKLSHPMLPGVTSQHPASEPEGKKVRPPRRAKTPRRSSKQNKLRITPPRHRGDFLHSLGPLRARRLRRPPWVLTRSCHPPPPRGTDPARTLGQPSSDIAGSKSPSPAACPEGKPEFCSRTSQLKGARSQGVSAPGQPSCVTSEQSLWCGEEEKEEDDYRRIPRPCSPSSSSRTLKDLSPSAGEHGDCHPPNAAVVPALSLQADTCLAARDNLVPHSEGPDLGKPETQLLPSLDRVAAGPKSGTASDAPEPLPSGPSRALPCRDTAASGPACVSLGVRAAHTTVARHSVEPQGHSRTVGETVRPSTLGGKAPAQSMTQALLSGKCLSEQIISGSAPLGSVGQTHLKRSTSGPSSANSHQEEGRPKTCLPSGGQSACRDIATSSPSLGSDVGPCQVSGLATVKGCVALSKPGQPLDAAEGPLKSIQKGGLEGMRKQPRVELSDTSSDDEDRLVIEL